jgi:hypothetical protein
VLVVVARPTDEVSAALVRRWHAHDARLLTASDLSRPGWRISNRDGDAQTAVVGGERTPTHRIAGVLVRTPMISSAELSLVVREDRSYCAAEMTAFLTWWLTRLPVPVINRPTALSLAGPGWRPATWHLTAQRAGLQSAGARWRARSQDRDANVGRSRHQPPDRSRIEVVTVISQVAVGPADTLLARQAVALSRAAGTEAVAVAFDLGSDPPAFLWAEPWVDIAVPDVADALLESLLGLGPNVVGER